MFSGETGSVLNDISLQIVISHCILSGLVSYYGLVSGIEIAARLYTWIEGETMSSTGTTPALLYREGFAVGSLCLVIFI